ncbi:hypothetical protein QUA40_12220 [Microcoleus sp. Pol11C3]|uniref:hypothetical protein n=1 Tax=Microcoleus sp. Pol11C3 TaxID=3055390 RepID=UPI002FD3F4F3
MLENFITPKWMELSWKDVEAIAFTPARPSVPPKEPARCQLASSLSCLERICAVQEL